MYTRLGNGLVCVMDCFVIYFIVLKNTVCNGSVQTFFLPFNENYTDITQIRFQIVFWVIRIRSYICIFTKTIFSFTFLLDGWMSEVVETTSGPHNMSTSKSFVITMQWLSRSHVCLWYYKYCSNLYLTSYLYFFMFTIISMNIRQQWSCLLNAYHLYTRY